MTPDSLQELVTATATELGIPGAAVGVLADGRETYACHGVTSLDNPVPVDPDTLFLLGSVTKTYTATAIMRLVAEGRIDLQAPVRTYVPELRLIDESVAQRVTLLHLLNHTAGLDWGAVADTGDGDDALAANVALLARVKLIAPLGARASYSQAGYNLVGRAIEKVTGLTFERALATLLFEPVGLGNTFHFAADVLTRRFAVGHNRDANGSFSIARLWKRWRGDNPGADLSSSVSDQLRWARFHLGDGTAASGARVMPAELLHRMKEPTVKLRASTLGDSIGIAWFIRDIDGARTVGHAGSSNGQFAELLLVPERNFAIVSLANAGPNGIPFNRSVIQTALTSYLGLVEREPKPLPFDALRIQEIVGRYEIDAMILTVGTDGAKLWLEVNIRPEIRAGSKIELHRDLAPAEIGLLPGGADEYVVLDGAMKGQRGYFSRNERGAVVGADIAGRFFARAREAAGANPG